MNDIETIRENFRPTRIKVLFVGESAPASGKFFYLENTKLYREMRKAFRGGERFLADFRKQGFFLDDLVPVPINRRSRPERRQCHKSSVSDLSTRIRKYQPKRLVAIGYSIEDCVRAAAIQANFSGEIDSVPFPSFPRDVARFQIGMARILQSRGTED